jgi:hypothetical protein
MAVLLVAVLGLFVALLMLFLSVAVLLVLFVAIEVQLIFLHPSSTGVFSVDRPPHLLSKKLSQ